MESQLSVVGETPSLVAELRAQLNDIATMQRNVATATPATLLTLRAEVTASIAASQQLTSQARGVATTGQAVHDAAIAESTRRTAQSLAADLFERRIFDPYLKFASDEEAAQYRQREADARRYIEDELSKKTPTGTLNATGALAGQMLDAHAHGAGDSPNFAPRWKEITQALSKQRRAMQAQGLSTEECDRNLQGSVRRYLAGKGLSAEQIDAQLRQSTDPLDAVKPYLRTEQDALSLQAEVAAQPVAAPVPATVSESPAESTTALGAVAASLQASGVTMPGAAVPDGHGVSASVGGGAVPRTV